MNWINDDASFVWHPFTQHFNASSPIAIKKALGTWLFPVNEEIPPVVDLISSWWVNLFGHCHPFICEKINEQIHTLDHVLFAGFSHEKASTLAKELIGLTQNNYEKVFFSDNGSTAVEVALKIAFQFFYNRFGQRRKRLLALKGGYHGDTFGAMAVGKKSCFFTPFEQLLSPVYFIECCYIWNDMNEKEERELKKNQQKILDKLNKYLKKYAHETAALIIEPMIQGSNGMRIISKNFLENIIELVRSYGIFIIYDEVMSGFGRTGKMFAYEHLNHKADLLCLSKGITGGFLPLGATLVTKDIFESFLDPSFQKAFAHGHSYTANPISCAAACATMNLLQSSSTPSYWKKIYETHQEGLHLLKKDHGSILIKPRILGTISAIDATFLDAYGGEKNAMFRDECMKNGLLIRPLGQAIYILPPYVIESCVLMQSYEKISQIIKKFKK
jgi:adenosylmethionine-8-amino-7-oxononanoate aminotransferase